MTAVYVISLIDTDGEPAGRLEVLESLLPPDTLMIRDKGNGEFVIEVPPIRPMNRDMSVPPARSGAVGVGVPVVNRNTVDVRSLEQPETNTEAVTGHGVSHEDNMGTSDTKATTKDSFKTSLPTSATTDLGGTLEHDDDSDADGDWDE